MKYIAKRKGHIDCLYDDNNNPPVNSQEATIRWNAFRRSRNYCRLLNLQSEEQYGLCAYSEIRPEEHGFGIHVEHVKPKSKFPRQTFDYMNLVVSSLSSADLEHLKIKHLQENSSCFGGHSKLNHFDRKQFISPLRAISKKNYFLYLSNGKVIPNPRKTRRFQKKAKHTIGLLNLNHPMLVTLRKDWIEELDQLIDQHLRDDMCLESLARTDLEPVGGKLSNFFTATCQRFGSQITALINKY